MTLKYDRAVCVRPFVPAPYSGIPWTFGDMATVLYNKRTKFDGTEPLLLSCHGHGGSALLAGPAFPYFGNEIMEFARAGYIVLAIDHGGANGWTSRMVDWVVTNAITWAQSAGNAETDFVTGLGAKAGKIVIVGYSMGGGVAVTYAKNHQAKIGACIGYNPAVDMDAFYGPEVDMLMNVAGTTPFCQITAGLTLNQVGQTVAVTNGMNLPNASGILNLLRSQGSYYASYTGRDATHVYGVTVASGTQAITAGNLFIGGGNYSALAGFDARNDAVAGLYAPGVYTVPTRIWHGSLDTTVTPAMVNGFLTAANNPIIEDHVIVGGNHTDIFMRQNYLENIPWLAQYVN